MKNNAKFLAGCLLAGIVTSQNANAQTVSFYCDYYQSRVLDGSSWKNVVQTIQPARFRFQIDVNANKGVFWSCPGNSCGAEYYLIVSKTTSGYSAAHIRRDGNFSGERFSFDENFSRMRHDFPPSEHLANCHRG